jgi:hypothetical protein
MMWGHARRPPLERCHRRHGLSTSSDSGARRVVRHVRNVADGAFFRRSAANRAAKFYARVAPAIVSALRPNRFRPSTNRGGWPALRESAFARAFAGKTPPKEKRGDLRRVAGTPARFRGSLSVVAEDGYAFRTLFAAGSQRTFDRRWSRVRPAARATSFSRTPGHGFATGPARPSAAPMGATPLRDGDSTTTLSSRLRGPGTRMASRRAWLAQGGKHHRHADRPRPPRSFLFARQWTARKLPLHRWVKQMVGSPIPVPSFVQAGTARNGAGAAGAVRAGRAPAGVGRHPPSVEVHAGFTSWPVAHSEASGGVVMLSSCRRNAVSKRNSAPRRAVAAVRRSGPHER